MTRIVGVDIPENKFIIISLTYIYGIGKSLAKQICDNSKIGYYILVKNLNKYELKIIRNNILKYIIEGDLRREVMLNIKRLVDINCYRGLRHRKHLPVRGQRTKTNSKTCKKNFNYIK